MNKFLKILVLILITGFIIVDLNFNLIPINIDGMYILVIFLGLIGLSIYISSRQTKYEDLKETYLYQRNTTIYVVVLVIILNIVFPVSDESFLESAIQSFGF